MSECAHQQFPMLGFIFFFCCLYIYMCVYVCCCAYIIFCPQFTSCSGQMFRERDRCLLRYACWYVWSPPARFLRSGKTCRGYLLFHQLPAFNPVENDVWKQSSTYCTQVRQNLDVSQEKLWIPQILASPFPVWVPGGSAGDSTFPTLPLDPPDSSSPRPISLPLCAEPRFVWTSRQMWWECATKWKSGSSHSHSERKRILKDFAGEQDTCVISLTDLILIPQ